MKIYLAFILLLSTVFSSYAQEKTDSLSYPELIPILENGLYGYCDKDKNIIIEPQFEWVTFFEEDLDFIDIKDPEKKAFESRDYATIWQNGQRMRIDKTGKMVYQYNQEDFNEISPKESMNPALSKQPFEKFQDDGTQLWGIRHAATGNVLIPAMYPIIEEELYSIYNVPQYPLILVSSATGETKFYVGLNGIEYRVETITASTKTEDYKIDYRVYLSGSDPATAEMRDAMVLWDEANPYIRAYVTTEKIRVENNSYPSFVQIVNFADSTSFRYWTQIDSTKTVQQKGAIAPQISFDPFSEEPYMEAMSLTLTDDTQTIAGYPCNLARIAFGKDMEYLVWYVKNLPKLFFGKHDFLKNIPGLPLKITVRTKQTDFEFGIMATVVEKLKIDPLLFEAPKNNVPLYNISSNDSLNSLPYPELIPVRQHGLFGYCDSNMNVVIEPEFYHAEFYETDLSFQIGNVNNPDIVRFGTADYAWVETGDNKRYRIDKKGNKAYHYVASDFKSDATFISLYESKDFQITGLDSTTLLQIVNHSKIIDDSTFFEITKIDKIENPKAGMLIICHPHKEDLPFTYFRDEQTQLEGIKNMETGAIVIEPKYTMLTALFNDMIKLNWHPFYLAYAPGINSSFYVDLNGKEYIIRTDQ